MGALNSLNVILNLLWTVLSYNREAGLLRQKVALYKVQLHQLGLTGGGGYNIKLGTVYKVVNSVSRKDHHILVQECFGYKVFNSLRSRAKNISNSDFEKLLMCYHVLV